MDTPTLLKINKFATTDADFPEKIKQLLTVDTESHHRIHDRAMQIIDDVKKRGDVAIIEATAKFDAFEVDDMASLLISHEEMHNAFEQLDAPLQGALKEAAKRIRSYHDIQKSQCGGEGFRYTEEDGTVLGQKITPIKRVGIYVPGGKAAYPSSVLMNAIPARVAGVEEIVMVVPTPKGEKNSLVLAAAYLAQVDKVWTIGGAQAIAALAFGTKSILPVDKIVGPGNAYVAAAKRAVFGTVGIDMIAGPSEILILCDGKTNPDWVAMDLFSQAEHDELAQSILLCPDIDYLNQVEKSMEKLLPTQARRSIIHASINKRGAFILVRDMEEACVIANNIAAEHVEISTDNPWEWANRIHHAGALFLGRFTSEALGDYCAGPNHVLPTARTARFSSPLGVYDFQKRTSMIEVSIKGAQTLGQVAQTLAKGEGLYAHGSAAAMRFNQDLRRNQ